MRAENEKHNPQDLRNGIILGKPFREKTPATQTDLFFYFNQLKVTKPLGLESNHEEEVTQLENFKGFKPVDRRADLIMIAAERGFLMAAN